MMKIDELGDDALLFSIPLNRAALLLALEQGGHDGVDFTEEDLAPYSEDDKYKDAFFQREYSVYRNINELLSIEPVGRIKRCRDFFLERMINSVERGELKTDAIRREISGTVVPHETWIDLDHLEKWAEIHGLDFVDLWNEYLNRENELHDQLCKSISSYRERQAAWKFWEQKELVFSELPEAHRNDYIRILQENSELRTKQHSSSQASGVDSQFGKRARDTLLRMLAAIAYDCYRDKLNTPYSIAKDIQDAASQIGISVSDDTIATRLKEALAMIDPNFINHTNRIRKR